MQTFDDSHQIIRAIIKEVERASGKHPHWPHDQIHAAAIVQEEAGELIRAAVQYEREGGELEEIQKEAIQTAATAIRLLEYLNHAHGKGMPEIKKAI